MENYGLELKVTTGQTFLKYPFCLLIVHPWKVKVRCQICDKAVAAARRQASAAPDMR